MADKLIMYEDRGVYRIGWYLSDEDDMGITLGEDLSDIARCEDKDHKAATLAINAMGDVESDTNGFYWNSKPKAQVALRIAKQAVKDLSTLSQWPLWAKQALAAGWKPPKGQVIDRDLNAAINLQNYGLNKIGMACPELTPVDKKALVYSSAIGINETVLGEAGISVNTHLCSHRK